MKTFNLKRFWNLLKWVLVYDRQKLFTTCCGIFFAYMVVFLGNNAFTTEQNQFDLIRICNLSAVVFCLYMILSATNILTNMKTKQQIISYKMLPATNLEKFIARYLVITVVNAIIGITMFLAADVVRMVLNALYTGTSAQSIVPIVIDGLIVTLPEEAEGFEVGVLYMTPIWLHSAYMLGGVLFRRSKFALTSLALFLSFVVSIQILVWTGPLHDVNAFVIDSLLAIGIVFDYVMSYILFKRIQVINNKWLNL